VFRRHWLGEAGIGMGMPALALLQEVISYIRLVLEMER
jgi:hypothetical protein